VINEGQEMTEKVLVTGAAGFIGSHLTEALLDAGYDVTGIDSLTEYYDVRLKQKNLERFSDRERFRLIAGSINDVDLDSLLDGQDYIMHLAAQAGVRASWGRRFEDYIDANVRATQRLCEAAKNKTVKKLVYASSSSVYGDTVDLPMKESHPTRPVSPYGVTKLDGENLCLLYRKQFGLPVVCLRFFTVFGPRQRPDMAIHRFLVGALTGAPVAVFGNGSQTRDFTYVSDIVAANLAAMRYQGEEAVFNVGGGQRASLNRVLDLVGSFSAGQFDVRFGNGEKGDVQHTYADTELARRELGFAPQVSLEEGVKRQAEWVRSLLPILREN